MGRLKEGLDLDSHIYEAWRNGWSLKQTAQSVKYAFGEDLTREQVRLRFVTLSERYARKEPPPLALPSRLR